MGRGGLFREAPMGMFSEGIDVVCTPAGQPLELTWAGRQYTVCAEPVRHPEETLTLDLTRNTSSGRWRLLRIHDALRPQSA